MDKNSKEENKRPICKYGAQCYQKNPIHLKKYKHITQNEDVVSSPAKKRKLNEELKHHEKENEDKSEENISTDSKIEEKPSVEKTNLEEVKVTSSKGTDFAEFIREKFLVEMPADFYKFWDFCKSLSPKNPCKALEDAGLTLVGPFDVLAGKFCNKSFEDNEYLLHWRFFYDIPEFQTVLVRDDESGFHIGYFRDDPSEKPIFLASNTASKDGIFKIAGANIFAAAVIYLEETLKTCDPFKKIKLAKLKDSIKSEAIKLNYSVSLKSENISKREKKTVTRTFNKIGLLVPYNRKTQLGYRELAMNDRELKSLLEKIKQADCKEIEDKLMNDLQPVITNALIALDESDFGTGLELGWDLWFYGVDRLNGNATRFMKHSYNLLDRDEFASIIIAHSANRKKGNDLSIIKN